jgi:hypothetical protein
MIARQLSSKEILSLPPTISLATLAQCLGVSEPTMRACHRSGELERLGIRVNRLGLQWRVVTSTVLDYLGLGGRDTAPASGGNAGQDRPAVLVLRPVGVETPHKCEDRALVRPAPQRRRSRDA